MVIRKEELALYSLSLLEADERPNVKFSKEKLAYALDIKVSTLNLYFTNLKNSGYLTRHKKKYYEDIRQTVEITEEGKKRIREIDIEFQNSMLTPERHNIPNIVKVEVVLHRIDDILEKIFFLSLYLKLKRFDLPLFLETFKTSKQSNNVVNVLSEIGHEEEIEEMPVVETFFKSRLYGITGKDSMIDFKGSRMDDPNSLLIIAEASVKQGRIADARMIYQHLLSSKIPVSQNQWTIASIYLAHLDSREGNVERCLSELQRIHDDTDNKIFRTYTKQMMARVHYTSGNHDLALELYKSAINSFRKFGLPLMLAITHNNRGIIYYIKEEFVMAEDDWKKARKYAKDAGSRYIEGAVFNNLAGIELNKGNMEKSWKYTDMAFERFREVNDLEGVSWCEFQLSEYYLANKDLENAKLHYHRSGSMGNLSLSPGERKMRKDIFLERGVKNGFSEDQLKNIIEGH